MEKIKILMAHKVFKIIKWAFLILIILYAIAVVIRGFGRAEESKINEQVEKIHNTKLTMDDVMGVNLPPDPGELADATVEGVDANNNVIRDDVELAVFKEYPDSAKTRAVLLQYALVLQEAITQPILNEETATAVAEEESRAFECIGNIVKEDDIDAFISYMGYVQNLEFNTLDRKKGYEIFNDKVRSFELRSNCDVDLSLFTN